MGDRCNFDCVLRTDYYDINTNEARRQPGLKPAVLFLQHCAKSSITA